MSSSRHPVALSIERQVGGATRLLATIMCLPLVDGIFPALVLAGALDATAGILEVGLLIFGGSATVAVILAEMDGDRRETVRAVLGVGAVLVPVAAIEAALAPTIASVLVMPVFERFAALVILAVAASTASARVAEWLPRPALIVAAGLIASVSLGDASLAVSMDPGLVVRAVAAASVGVGFALVVAIAAPWLRSSVDIDRFRFGSAVALGVLGISVLGLIPGDAPVALAVLGVTAVFAFDPGDASVGPREPPAGDRPSDESADERVGAVADGGNPAVDPVEDVVANRTDAAGDADQDAGEADRNADADREADMDADEADDEESVASTVSNYITSDGERAPWL